MSTLNINNILIIEPKPDLTKPYLFLPQDSQQLHLSSVPQTIKYLNTKTPDIIMLSASYSPSKSFILLEAMKKSVQDKLFLTPLVFVIDLTQPTSFIPGTFWGQKLAIIHTLSSKKEVELTLTRVCQEQKNLGFI